MGIFFSIFFNMKVCCVFSIEFNFHRGDSNEFTQHTMITIKRKSPEIIPNTIMFAAMGFSFVSLLGTQR